LKTDNDPDELMRAIGKTIKAVPPFAGEPWSQRLVIGVWTVRLAPSQRSS
jgi:phosphatidylglycerol phospholipase C